MGERSVGGSGTKMDVFYIGVENPVQVSAAGVNSRDVKVSMSGGGAATIAKGSDGNWVVNATRPAGKNDPAFVNVTAPGLSEKRAFRIKPIPTPVPKLSAKRGGAMSSGEFRAQGGVIADLENFDFEARCNIKGYRVVRVAKRKDPEIEINVGAKYGAASRIIQKASPGDRYYFENIKCTCPGDKGPRDLGSMSFVIK